MIPFSILDLSPIARGATPGEALYRTLDLARHAEDLGFERFWVAEHHNMPGIASSATAVVIGHVAAGTKTIRVGAGGVMLPNHAPLVVAEQFGTLASLFPGRIDLGLGRAPGTDMATARALRRDILAGADSFPADIAEIQGYLAPLPEGARPPAIRAIPGTGTEVPIWILGSSLYGAKLAAELGLPYAFASHFAPADLMEALALYRGRFKPSRQSARPHAMIGVNVFAAETDREARRQFTSLQQAFLNLRRGAPGPIPPPVEDLAAATGLSPGERAGIDEALALSVVGSPETVEHDLRTLIDEIAPDELMVTGHFFDHSARLRSFEIVAAVRDKLAATV